MLKFLLNLLRNRQSAGVPYTESRIIDPNDVFADDGRWAEPDAGSKSVIWRIRTPEGATEVDGTSIEVVDGALHVLDGDEDVLLALEPGAWEWVGAATGRPEAVGTREDRPATEDPDVRAAA